MSSLARGNVQTFKRSHLETKDPLPLCQPFTEASEPQHTPPCARLTWTNSEDHPISILDTMTRKWEQWESEVFMTNAERDRSTLSQIDQIPGCQCKSRCSRYAGLCFNIIRLFLDDGLDYPFAVRTGFRGWEVVLLLSGRWRRWWVVVVVWSGCKVITSYMIITIS